MSDKNLQETKALNAKARQNSTPSGASKISLTQGTPASSFTSNIGTTNSLSSGTEQAKQLNQQSRQSSGFTSSTSTSSSFTSDLEEAKQLNKKSRENKSTSFQ